MRGKYRSAVYVKDDASAEQARRIIAELARETGSAFVTAVLPFRAFKASDKRFQNYYDRNREGPFCNAYIEPKLALLRQRFAGLRREVGNVV
jgi:peptide-methionine (S)-S-oxide reductase